MKPTRPFTEADWLATPEPVQKAFIALEERVLELEEKVEKLTALVEKLEARLNKNSGNSSKPPSSDGPFKRPKSSRNPSQKGKPGGKKGHNGFRQEVLPPTETNNIEPGICSCGGTQFSDSEPYYTHQVIELPEIKMDVSHYVLHKGRCSCCGKTCKAVVPKEHRAGYGPRFSSLIAEMAGVFGNSRSSIKEFCLSSFDIHISLGAIQKVIDRASLAIKPHYEEIAKEVRCAAVANIDETSFPQNGSLAWLWVMATQNASYFMIHQNRSKKAFEELIADWRGVLISDGYGVYKKWINHRQACLAHLIRTARELSERKDSEISGFGKWAMAQLQLLCHMAYERPTQSEWDRFYIWFIRLIALHHSRKDDAGKLARRLERELEHLWIFLEIEGVSPTNNHAERMIRFAVLWRKRCYGTNSDKGARWVERILSLRQTCRLKKKRTWPVIVDAIKSYFKYQEPDLKWVCLS